MCWGSVNRCTRSECARVSTTLGAACRTGGARLRPDSRGIWHMCYTLAGAGRQAVYGNRVLESCGPDVMHIRSLGVFAHHLSSSRGHSDSRLLAQGHHDRVLTVDVSIVLRRLVFAS